MNAGDEEHHRSIALLMSDAYAPFYDYLRPYATPGGDHVWQGTEFVVNPRSGTFEGIVVLQSDRPLDRTYRLRCPAGQTLLVVQEPPDILQLRPRYVRQFATKLAHPGLLWTVELGIDEALARTTWPKGGLISAVVSNKQSVAGHRRRYQLMKALKAHFGDRLDWFGRGVQDLGKAKIKGLLDYKYHIVLENGSWQNYWTEKLSDAFVANCFPFYWGAPNIGDYFDRSALRTIDVNDPEKTIHVIETAIAQDAYGKSQEALARARRQVLTQYHPYESYLRALSRGPRGRISEVELRPFNEFPPPWPKRLRNTLGVVKRAILRRGWSGK